MESRTPRRRFRFLSPLKKAAFAAAVILLAAPLCLKSEIKPGGYFSFSCLKGQSQSGLSHGSFQDLGGGIFFMGQVTKEFDVAFEVRFGIDSKVELQQALISYKLGPDSSIKLGLFLVPFGKYNESSRPFQTLLVRAPMNIAGAYPEGWRDIGVCIGGKWSMLNYAFYAGNGLGEKDGIAAGELYKDINKDKGKGGRVGLSLGQGIEAGISYYSGKFDAENSRKLTIKGADLTYVTQGYEIRGEYTKAAWNNGDGLADGRSEGFHILSSMDFGNIRPIVCYQRWDAGESSLGYRLLPQEDGPDIPGKRTRWAFALRYAIGPTFALKIEYDRNLEKSQSLKNDVLQIQAALSF